MLTDDEKYRMGRDIAQVCATGACLLMLSVVYLTGLSSVLQKGLVLLTQASLIYIVIAASLSLGTTIREVRYRSLRQ